MHRCSCLEHRDDLPPAPTLSVLFILFKMSRYTPAYSRFAHLSPQPGWEVTSVYRPEVLFAQSGNTTYFLLPWREAVEVKPEPIDWTVINGVKFAPLEFQYTQPHLHVDPVREAGVFEYLESDTTYYEVQLSHRGRSEFESAARKSYTFDEEGKLSPLHNNPDSVWEADALARLRRLNKFSVTRAGHRQRPKAGTAYIGSQGSFTIILIFGEIGEIVFSSVNGGTEEIQYVRYYPVGIEPGALLTVAYTTGGEAHFLVLRDSQNSVIKVEKAFYDMNIISRWDDVGAAMTIMAHEQSMLPPARLQPGGTQLQGLLLEVLSPPSNGFPCTVGVSGSSD